LGEKNGGEKNGGGDNRVVLRGRLIELDILRHTPGGVPILKFDAVVAGRVAVGNGPLHTQFDNQGYAYTSLTFVQDRALLSYYVHDEQTGRISSRFRSLPVRWLYEKE